jgi:hypothetical protein
MLANQTLATEVQSVITGNTTYSSYYPIWKYLLESYLGGEEYRRAGHLTRYQSESDQEYAARLRATPLDNHCQSVISVYNSFLFRREPQRDFGVEPNQELESFLRDSDFDGRSLDSFMKDVATWSSVFGHCWIVVAKPNVGAVTRADEIAQGIRPFVSLLTPMVVLDWRYTRTASGRYELSYFKYIEDINGDVRTVKEWRVDSVRTIVVDLKRETVSSDFTEENQLNRIPVVCAYNGRSTVRGIGISDIADIADAQRFIYNAKSEIFQSIQLDSHPSLVATQDTQIGTGSGALIKVAENMDPGLKPYVLDFGGADVSNILSSIEHTVASIDKMANTGAVRATESRTLSGVAMETEFSLLNARLSEKADNLELAEEQMWQFWFMYQNSQWMGSVVYPDSFNIRDTSTEITQLKTARETATDPRVLTAIDQRILDWMGDTEVDLTEFVPHIMTNPATGASVLATSNAQHLELAAQGWVHN